MKGVLLKTYGPVAAGLFFVSAWGLVKGCPFQKHWFYMFAWWNYILFADWLVLRLKKTSRLTSNPAGFLSLCAWSTFFWLIFEWFNLFLKNWGYLSVPSQLLIRWTGYAVAFATVLPGIFETYDLLSVLVKRKFEFRGLTEPTKYFPVLTITGLLFLLLPIAYPKYFFPLVWGGFVFLLEPINYLLNERESLIFDLKSGSLRRPVLLLLAGGVCGFLWEFWNFWAETKWVYSLPWEWLMKVKLFEMPVAGYLGFPPFALECWSMWVFLSVLKRAVPKKVLVVLAVAFSLFMFSQIDAHTVLTFRL